MMKMASIRVLAALYAFSLVGANAVQASPQQLRAEATGHMEKLVVYDEPVVPAVTAFKSFEGGPLDLSRYHGDVVLVNFWATWCAPCRKEMPSLDRLHKAYRGQPFEVVTIATGRNSAVSMEHFFETAQIETLPLHRDPDFSLAQGLGVEGLPYSFLLNGQGEVIAHLRGDAEWDSAEAHRVVQRALEQNGVEAQDE